MREVIVLSWWFLQAECCEDAPAEAPCPGSQEGSAEAHALFALQPYGVVADVWPMPPCPDSKGCVGWRLWCCQYRVLIAFCFGGDVK